jgi:large subunit ribosomal protein L29
MTKIKELREMSQGEIEKLLEEKKTKAVALRFDITSKQLKNNREFRSTKKDIARILTLQKEMKAKEKNN